MKEELVWTAQTNMVISADKSKNGSVHFKFILIVLNLCVCVCVCDCFVQIKHLVSPRGVLCHMHVYMYICVYMS